MWTVRCFTFEQDLEGLLWTGDLDLHTVHHIHTVTGVRPQDLGLGRPVYQSYTHNYSNISRIKEHKTKHVSTSNFGIQTSNLLNLFKFLAIMM